MLAKSSHQRPSNYLRFFVGGNRIAEQGEIVNSAKPSASLRQQWNNPQQPRRCCLHTCTKDHPAALPNQVPARRNLYLPLHREPIFRFAREQSSPFRSLPSESPPR